MTMLIMMRFWTAWILSIFVFLSSASADEENPVNKWIQDHVKGSVRYRNFSHFGRHKHEKMVRQEGILRLDVEQTFQERWRLFLTPQWKVDSANYTAGGFQDFRDTYQRDSYFYVREGHLKYRGDDFDLTVGKQFFTWGTAEGYNPTDNLNPRNYLDIPQREKMGIFSFSAGYYPTDASLSFVLIPLFSPSRLPLRHSRWTATSSLGERPEALGSGTEIGTIQQRELSGKRLDKMQVGFRAKKSISGWDFSLSYFDGFDTLPVIREDTNTNTATPRFNRMRIVGGDFSTTSGKLEYHGEWAVRLYEAGRATSILPFVFGGNYTWDEDQVNWLWLDQIIWTLEYSKDITLHKRDNPDYRESSIFTRPFQNAILSRLALKVDENNEFHLTGNYNIHRHRTEHHHNNSYLQPKIIHKFSDAWKIEGGVELFWGAQNSFWGKWKKNDRSFLFLTYLF